MHTFLLLAFLKIPQPKTKDEEVLERP